jgi:addiction module HigA family antidote
MRWTLIELDQPIELTDCSCSWLYLSRPALPAKAPPWARPGEAGRRGWRSRRRTWRRERGRARGDGQHLTEAIEASGIAAAQLARDIEVPPNQVTGILHGTHCITVDTALRLGRYFDNSAAFWMNLQQICDLRRAEQEMGDGLSRIPTRRGGTAGGRRTTSGGSRLSVLSGDGRGALVVTEANDGEEETRHPDGAAGVVETPAVVEASFLEARASKCAGRSAGRDEIARVVEACREAQVAV